MTRPDAARQIPTAVGRLAVTTRGAGPIAVLWHSLFVDDRSWDAVAGRLAAHRTLVRITGPGHGTSAPTKTPFTLEDCASAALEVLDAIGTENSVDWVGNAWGGHVGIVLAARKPGFVRTLTTFNTPVEALSPAQARAPRLAARVLAIAGPVGPVRDGVTKALLGERAMRPELAAYVHECLRSADRRALANAVRSISLGRPDLTPLLPRVGARTVFVTGAEDDLWTATDAEAAASRMPDASARTVPDSAHLTPLEQPDAAARIVLELWGAEESTR